MPLPCPGPAPISLGNIQTEFGGSNPIGLGEYYRNGGLVSSNNTNVPTSGTISLGNFFCAVYEIVVYITSNSENVNVQSLFGGNWTQNVPKRLIINSGVVVGSPASIDWDTFTAIYALTIPEGLVSTLRIDNYGSIQGGYGGYDHPIYGAVYYNFGGGNAILASSAVTINNIGSIYGGGGAGGYGGSGGEGYYVYECFQGTGQFSGDLPRQPGGAGGKGQGYAQDATGGEPGSDGYTYCGDGSGCDYYDEDGNLVSGGFVCLQLGTVGASGAGGNGGSFGNDGAPGAGGGNGNIGNGAVGAGQGTAGCYITNNYNVTWVNTGDRRGRVC